MKLTSEMLCNVAVAIERENPSERHTRTCHKFHDVEGKKFRFLAGDVETQFMKQLNTHEICERAERERKKKNQHT